MLSAQNRMRRSAEFDVAVKHGKWAVQPDIVIHVGRTRDPGDKGGPRVGLVVPKSVGSAVERHRVARRLRHVARAAVADLDRSERIVVRARPSSRDAISARLEKELRTGLLRIGKMTGRNR